MMVLDFFDLDILDWLDFNLLIVVIFLGFKVSVILFFEEFFCWIVFGFLVDCVFLGSLWECLYFLVCGIM